MTCEQARSNKDHVVLAWPCFKITSSVNLEVSTVKFVPSRALSMESNKNSMEKICGSYIYLSKEMLPELFRKLKENLTKIHPSRNLSKYILGKFSTNFKF